MFAISYKKSFVCPCTNIDRYSMVNIMLYIPVRGLYVNAIFQILRFLREDIRIYLQLVDERSVEFITSLLHVFNVLKRSYNRLFAIQVAQQNPLLAIAEAIYIVKGL